MLVSQYCQTLLTPTYRAHQALLSIEFCRQEYWSGMPFPSPGKKADCGRIDDFEP